MAGDTPEQHEMTTRPGWRDVYEAVQQSEKRIIGHIDDVVRPIQVASVDHEERLRVIEQGQTPWQVDFTRRQEATAQRVGHVESQVNGLKDRENGVFATLKGSQAVLIAFLAIGSFVISLIAALSH